MTWAPALAILRTLGLIFLRGYRRLDALLEAVAGWGEAQDLTGID